jgi:hypothetical protein
MKAALLRLARILVGQAISWGLLEWGGINVPIINITIGAAINSIFKFIRDKYPNSWILSWLPI